MRQLVRNQLSPVLRPRHKTPRTKYDVGTYGVGVGVYVARRSVGSSIGVHPYAGKVVAEALLHVLAQYGLKWSAWARENSVYAGGRCCDG